ncbi:MAG: fumarylacetoacetate hydrolase family protein [Rhodobacteraceae bacterium]|nr:fumarylacetoacetate hydrolase family protein [Paracoccaceae bacterium]
MKLARIGDTGFEVPAVLSEDGTYRDLSSVVGDIDGKTLSDMSWSVDLDISGLPRLPADARIGACVGSVGKLIGIGLNYTDHAAETGQRIPKEPILFGKATSSICGPRDDVILPRGSEKLDWEVELAVVIGRRASHVSEEDAENHIAGYCVMNDVSERAFQIERSGQWLKGKSADTFGPTGPWLVTRDEVADPQDLHLWMDVDGQRYQDGSTSTMIFGVRTLVSYVSQFMSLQPGDIITTGTPAGVGLGQNPQVFLRVGQTMKLGVEGLGEQCQTVVASR